MTDRTSDGGVDAGHRTGYITGMATTETLIDRITAAAEAIEAATIAATRRDVRDALRDLADAGDTQIRECGYAGTVTDDFLAGLRFAASLAGRADFDL